MKNKIASILKELDLISNENKSLKNDLDSHVCHAPSYNIPIVCSTSSSNIENDINILKKSVDRLGSTLSQCALNDTCLESMFRKKHAPYMHAHHTRHIHAHHAHTHDSIYAHVYTCTHCRRKGHLAKFCYDRVHNVNFANKFVWVKKVANLMDPRKCGYQNSPLLYLI